MRLSNDRLGLLGFLVVIVVAVIGSYAEEPSPGPSVRRPAVTAPVGGQPAVREFTVTIGARADSTGTAFSLGDGRWMTARHVVDGCDVTGVVERPGKGLRAQRVYVHPSADVALMTVGRAGPPVRFANREPQAGDVAYHVGFPRGQPGALRSRLIGAGMMNVTGRYSTRERVLAWAEVERVPNDSRPLSGLSGGPVFDAAGELIGVHVAGSKRRGRSFTASPASIAEALAADGVRASAQGVAPAFSPTSFVGESDALRASWTVAKALCDVR